MKYMWLWSACDHVWEVCVCVCAAEKHLSLSLFTFNLFYIICLKKSVLLLFFIFIRVLKSEKSTFTTTTTSAVRRAFRSKSKNHCAAADMFFLRFRLSSSCFIWEAPRRKPTCVCMRDQLITLLSLQKKFDIRRSVHYTLLFSNNILCVHAVHSTKYIKCLSLRLRCRSSCSLPHLSVCLKASLSRVSHALHSLHSANYVNVYAMSGHNRAICAIACIGTKSI